MGTATGKIYVSQNAGGSWTNISAGLDGSPVEDIITDPARGSHDAYAVTEDGVYYMADSVGASPTWVNITGGLEQLASSIFGQTYAAGSGTTAVPFDLALVLNSIAANWNYTIPNNSGSGYHPVLYVAANSGVYMSTNNGTSWTLYPDSTFGALVEGGDLPHVAVTDLSLSQGDISTASGMPALAGPYQTLTFSGALTSGSTTVTGIVDLEELTVGDFVAGTGIPSETTIVAINTTSDSITLSAKATATGEQSLSASDPMATSDPDLLLASTYGEGEFAINLAPMLFPATVAVASASGTTSDVTTVTPTIDGESEISGSGSTTWVSIIDETPGDATYGQIIGGFNPQTYDNGQSIIPNATNSTNSLGNFAITINAGAFTSDGLKTIEVETTDDAGAVSNKVTLSFTLEVPGLTPPAPPSAPTTPTLTLVTSTPGYTNTLTPELIGTTTAGATVDLYAVGSTTPLATTTANSLGNFTLTFTGTNDTTYTVDASASDSIGTSGFSSEVTFTILYGPPSTPTGFALAPTSDTGIGGDDITSDHNPVFVGTAVPYATIEMFEVVPAGQTSPIYGTAIANSSGNFSVSFSNILNDGTVSLYVEAIDPAGNVSAPSNILTVTIVSVASDYNGDSYSDAALYSRSAIGFTGILTSGSPLLTNLSSLTGLVSGAAISGTGVPSGTTISNVAATPFTGTLTTGSSLVSGLNGTTELFVGENVTGSGIPSGATIAGINNSTSITLSTNATATGPQNLRATSITLSANATASGLQSLTADVGVWLVENTADGPTNPPAFWFTSGTAFGPSDVTPFQGDFDGNGLANSPTTSPAPRPGISITLTITPSPRLRWARPM